MNIMRYTMLLTFIFILSGCSLSGNGPTSSRSKTKMLNSLMKKSGSIYKYSLSDNVEGCKKLKKFCKNRKFNRYGNPETDVKKNDNFYCVCLY